MVDSTRYSVTSTGYIVDKQTGAIYASAKDLTNGVTVKTSSSTSTIKASAPATVSYSTAPSNMSVRYTPVDISSVRTSVQNTPTIKNTQVNIPAQASTPVRTTRLVDPGQVVSDLLARTARNQTQIDTTSTGTRITNATGIGSVTIPIEQNMENAQASKVKIASIRGELEKTNNALSIERNKLRVQLGKSYITDNEATRNSLRFSELMSKKQNLINTLEMSSDILRNQTGSMTQQPKASDLQEAEQAFSRIGDNPFAAPKNIPMTRLETPAERAQSIGKTGTLIDPLFNFGDIAKKVTQNIPNIFNAPNIPNAYAIPTNSTEIKPPKNMSMPTNQREVKPFDTSMIIEDATLSEQGKKLMSPPGGFGQGRPLSMNVSIDETMQRFRNAANTVNQQGQFLGSSGSVVSIGKAGEKISPTSPEGKTIQDIYQRQAQTRLENDEQRAYWEKLTFGQASAREALLEPRTKNTYIKKDERGKVISITEGVPQERKDLITKYFTERGLSLDEAFSSIRFTPQQYENGFERGLLPDNPEFWRKEKFEVMTVNPQTGMVVPMVANKTPGPLYTSETERQLAVVANRSMFADKLLEVSNPPSTRPGAPSAPILTSNFISETKASVKDVLDNNPNVNDFEISVFDKVKNKEIIVPVKRDKLQVTVFAYASQERYTPQVIGPAGKLSKVKEDLGKSVNGTIVPREKGGASGVTLPQGPAFLAGAALFTAGSSYPLTLSGFNVDRFFPMPPSPPVPFGTPAKPSTPAPTVLPQPKAPTITLGGVTKSLTDIIQADVDNMTPEQLKDYNSKVDKYNKEFQAFSKSADAYNAWAKKESTRPIYNLFGYRVDKEAERISKENIQEDARTVGYYKDNPLSGLMWTTDIAEGGSYLITGKSLTGEKQPVMTDSLLSQLIGIGLNPVIERTGEITAAKKQNLGDAPTITNPLGMLNYYGTLGGNFIEALSSTDWSKSKVEAEKLLTDIGRYPLYYGVSAASEVGSFFIPFVNAGTAARLGSSVAMKAGLAFAAGAQKYSPRLGMAVARAAMSPTTQVVGAAGGVAGNLYFNNGLPLLKPLIRTPAIVPYETGRVIRSRLSGEVTPTGKLNLEKLSPYGRGFQAIVNYIPRTGTAAFMQDAAKTFADVNGIIASVVPRAFADRSMAVVPRINSKTGAVVGVEEEQRVVQPREFIPQPGQAKGQISSTNDLVIPGMSRLAAGVSPIQPTGRNLSDLKNELNTLTAKYNRSLEEVKDDVEAKQKLRDDYTDKKVILERQIADYRTYKITSPRQDDTFGITDTGGSIPGLSFNDLPTIGVLESSPTSGYGVKIPLEDINRVFATKKTTTKFDATRGALPRETNNVFGYGLDNTNLERESTSIGAPTALIDKEAPMVTIKNKPTQFIDNGDSFVNPYYYGATSSILAATKEMSQKELRKLNIRADKLKTNIENAKAKQRELVKKGYEKKFDHKPEWDKLEEKISNLEKELRITNIAIEKNTPEAKRPSVASWIDSYNELVAVGKADKMDVEQKFSRERLGDFGVSAAKENGVTVVKLPSFEDILMIAAPKTVKELRNRWYDPKGLLGKVWRNTPRTEFVIGMKDNQVRANEAIIKIKDVDKLPRELSALAELGIVPLSKVKPKIAKQLGDEAKNYFYVLDNSDAYDYYIMGKLPQSESGVRYLEYKEGLEKIEAEIDQLKEDKKGASRKNKGKYTRQIQDLSRAQYYVQTVINRMENGFFGEIGLTKPEEAGSGIRTTGMKLEMTVQFIDRELNRYRPASLGSLELSLPGISKYREADENLFRLKQRRAELQSEQKKTADILIGTDTPQRERPLNMRPMKDITNDITDVENKINAQEKIIKDSKKELTSFSRAVDGKTTIDVNSVLEFYNDPLVQNKLKTSATDLSPKQYRVLNMIEDAMVGSAVERGEITKEYAKALLSARTTMRKTIPDVARLKNAASHSGGRADQVLNANTKLDNIRSTLFAEASTLYNQRRMTNPLIRRFVRDQDTFTLGMKNPTTLEGVANEIQTLTKRRDDVEKEIKAIQNIINGLKSQRQTTGTKLQDKIRKSKLVQNYLGMAANFADSNEPITMKTLQSRLTNLVVASKNLETKITNLKDSIRVQEDSQESFLKLFGNYEKMLRNRMTGYYTPTISGDIAMYGEKIDKLVSLKTAIWDEARKYMIKDVVTGPDGKTKIKYTAPPRPSPISGGVNAMSDAVRIEGSDVVENGVVIPVPKARRKKTNEISEMEANSMDRDLGKLEAESSPELESERAAKDKLLDQQDALRNDVLDRQRIRLLRLLKNAKNKEDLIKYRSDLDQVMEEQNALQMGMMKRAKARELERMALGSPGERAFDVKTTRSTEGTFDDYFKFQDLMRTLKGVNDDLELQQNMRTATIRLFEQRPVKIALAQNDLIGRPQFKLIENYLKENRILAPNDNLRADYFGTGPAAVSKVRETYESALGSLKSKRSALDAELQSSKDMTQEFQEILARRDSSRASNDAGAEMFYKEYITANPAELKMLNQYSDLMAEKEFLEKSLTKFTKKPASELTSKISSIEGSIRNNNKKEIFRSLASNEIKKLVDQSEKVMMLTSMSEDNISKLRKITEDMGVSAKLSDKFRDAINAMDEYKKTNKPRARKVLVAEKKDIAVEKYNSLVTAVEVEAREKMKLVYGSINGLKYKTGSEGEILDRKLRQEAADRADRMGMEFIGDDSEIGARIYEDTRTGASVLGKKGRSVDRVFSDRESRKQSPKGVYNQRGVYDNKGKLVTDRATLARVIGVARIRLSQLKEQFSATPVGSAGERLDLATEMQYTNNYLLAAEKQYFKTTGLDNLATYIDTFTKASDSITPDDYVKIKRNELAMYGSSLSTQGVKTAPMTEMPITPSQQERLIEYGHIARGYKMPENRFDASVTIEYYTTFNPTLKQQIENMHELAENIIESRKDTGNIEAVKKKLASVDKALESFSEDSTLSPEMRSIKNSRGNLDKLDYDIRQKEKEISVKRSEMTRTTDKIGILNSIGDDLRFESNNPGTAFGITPVGKLVFPGGNEFGGKMRSRPEDVVNFLQGSVLAAKNNEALPEIPSGVKVFSVYESTSDQIRSLSETINKDRPDMAFFGTEKSKSDRIGSVFQDGEFMDLVEKGDKRRLSFSPRIGVEGGNIITGKVPILSFAKAVKRLTSKERKDQFKLLFMNAAEEEVRPTDLIMEAVNTDNAVILDLFNDRSKKANERLVSLRTELTDLKSKKNSMPKKEYSPKKSALEKQIARLELTIASTRNPNAAKKLAREAANNIQSLRAKLNTLEKNKSKISDTEYEKSKAYYLEQIKEQQVLETFNKLNIFKSDPETEKLFEEYTKARNKALSYQNGWTKEKETQVKTQISNLDNQFVYDVFLLANKWYLSGTNKSKKLADLVTKAKDYGDWIELNASDKALLDSAPQIEKELASNPMMKVDPKTGKTEFTKYRETVDNLQKQIDAKTSEAKQIKDDYIPMNILDEPITNIENAAGDYQPMFKTKASLTSKSNVRKYRDAAQRELDNIEKDLKGSGDGRGLTDKERTFIESNNDVSDQIKDNPINEVFSDYQRAKQILQNEDSAKIKLIKELDAKKWAFTKLEKLRERKFAASKELSDANERLKQLEFDMSIDNEIQNIMFDDPEISNLQKELGDITNNIKAFDDQYNPRIAKIKERIGEAERYLEKNKTANRYDPKQRAQYDTNIQVQSQLDYLRKDLTRFENEIKNNKGYQEAQKKASDLRITIAKKLKPRDKKIASNLKQFIKEEAKIKNEVSSLNDEVNNIEQKINDLPVDGMDYTESVYRILDNNREFDTQGVVQRRVDEFKKKISNRSTREMDNIIQALELVKKTEGNPAFKKYNELIKIRDEYNDIMNANRSQRLNKRKDGLRLEINEYNKLLDTDISDNQIVSDIQNEVDVLKQTVNSETAKYGNDLKTYAELKQKQADIKAIQRTVGNKKIGKKKELSSRERESIQKKAMGLAKEIFIEVKKDVGNTSNLNKDVPKKIANLETTLGDMKVLKNKLELKKVEADQAEAEKYFEKSEQIKNKLNAKVNAAKVNLLSQMERLYPEEIAISKLKPRTAAEDVLGVINIPSPGSRMSRPFYGGDFGLITDEEIGKLNSIKQTLVTQSIAKTDDASSIANVAKQFAQGMAKTEQKTGRPTGRAERGMDTYLKGLQTWDLTGMAGIATLDVLSSAFPPGASGSEVITKQNNIDQQRPKRETRLSDIERLSTAGAQTSKGLNIPQINISRKIGLTGATAGLIAGLGQGALGELGTLPAMKLTPKLNMDVTPKLIQLPKLSSITGTKLTPIEKTTQIPRFKQVTKLTPLTETVPILKPIVVPDFPVDNIPKLPPTPLIKPFPLAFVPPGSNVPRRRTKKTKYPKKKLGWMVPTTPFGYYSPAEYKVIRGKEPKWLQGQE
jgi:hypothetical protein